MNEDYPREEVACPKCGEHVHANECVECGEGVYL